MHHGLLLWRRHHGHVAIGWCADLICVHLLYLCLYVGATDASDAVKRAQPGKYVNEDGTTKAKWEVAADLATKKRRADTLAKLTGRDASDLCQIVDPNTGLACAHRRISSVTTGTRYLWRYCSAGPHGSKRKRQHKFDRSRNNCW